MIAAGKLTKKIIIQENIIAKDSFGSDVLEWKDKIITRSDVSNSSGNRITENAEITHLYSITFKIRHYYNVDESMRVLYAGKYYRILSIDRESDDMSIEINTELINE